MKVTTRKSLDELFLRRQTKTGVQFQAGDEEAQKRAIFAQAFLKARDEVITPALEEMVAYLAQNRIKALVVRDDGLLGTNRNIRSVRIVIGNESHISVSSSSTPTYAFIGDAAHREVRFWRKASSNATSPAFDGSTPDLSQITTEFVETKVRDLIVQVFKP